MEPITVYQVVPVEFLEVQAHFGDRYPGQFVEDAYALWLTELANHTAVVYSSLQEHWREAAYAEFCRRYPVPRSLAPSDAYYDWHDEMDSVLAESGGLRAIMETKHITSELWRYCNMHRKGRRLYIDMHDVLERLKDEINGGGPYPEWIAPEIWPLWFAQQTAISPDQQQTLRRLPYREYLKTDYWRRVRFSMLVIFQLRCQSSQCVGLDSWWGSEGDLHVHHLHYKNRGREQLDNLILLCSRCHKAVHDEKLELRPIDLLRRARGPVAPRHWNDDGKVQRPDAAPAPLDLG